MTAMGRVEIARDLAATVGRSKELRALMLRKGDAVKTAAVAHSPVRYGGYVKAFQVVGYLYRGLWSARVRNTNFKAAWIERGTGARHHESGKSTGTMPAFHTLRRALTAARRVD